MYDLGAGPERSPVFRTGELEEPGRWMVGTTEIRGWHCVLVSIGADGTAESFLLEEEKVLSPERDVHAAPEGVRTGRGVVMTWTERTGAP